MGVHKRGGANVAVHPSQIEQLRVELSQQKQKVKLDVDKQRKKLQDKLTRTEV